jgi:hypothetical protein
MKTHTKTRRIGLRNSLVKAPIRTLLLLLLTALLDSSTLSQAPVPTSAHDSPLLFEQRVQIDAQRKKVRIQGWDWDDKTDQLSFTVKLTNTDTRTAFNDCRAEFYIFAQSVVDRNAYRLVGSEQFDFSLPPRAVHRFSTQEVITRWDSTVARFGAKYDGWALIVRDSAQQVICKKATNAQWIAVADKLNTLAGGKFYDRTLKPLAHVR